MTLPRKSFVGQAMSSPKRRASLIWNKVARGSPTANKESTTAAKII